TGSMANEFGDAGAYVRERRTCAPCGSTDRGAHTTTDCLTQPPHGTEVVNGRRALRIREPNAAPSPGSSADLATKRPLSVIVTIALSTTTFGPRVRSAGARSDSAGVTLARAGYADQMRRDSDTVIADAPA